MNFNQFLNESKEITGKEKYEFVANYCKQKGYNLHAVRKYPVEYRIVKENGSEPYYTTIFGYALLDELYQWCLKH